MGRQRPGRRRYQNLAEAFRAARIQQVVLEHCTLDYDMMTLWDLWNFQGEFAVGVIDQRRDEVETAAEIAARTAPALVHFPPERLLLTSECGFQHVPLDVTRSKMRALVSGATHVRETLARNNSAGTEASHA